MGDFFFILLSTALVNNVVLVKFLGLCPFMGVSRKTDAAIGMGLATTFVLTLAAGASWMVEALILEPLDLTFLRILSLILVIAAIVQFIEVVMRKLAPGLHRALGIYLPLITTNCAVLGVALPEHPGGARACLEPALRLRFGLGLHPRPRDLRRYARASGAAFGARSLRGRAHRLHFRRSPVDGLHGLRGTCPELTRTGAPP